MIKVKYELDINVLKSRSLFKDENIDKDFLDYISKHIHFYNDGRCIDLFKGCYI